MAQRPGLSDETFLAHVFKPSRNPKPTGLRKTTLKGTHNRSKKRLAAFNRMSAVNQHILSASGQREQYLRGEANLADAKRALRTKAVDRGIVKPLRVRVRLVRPAQRRTQLTE